MKKITVSAPGKLILFGEHAVVYGAPCIVTAVNKRIHVQIEYAEGNEDILETPKVNNLNFVHHTIEKFKRSYNIKNWLKITTSSDFNDRIGLGSSSAVTAALAKGLSEFFSVPLTDKELFNFCYEIILDIQKRGSGADLAASIFGGTQYFVSGGKVIEHTSVEDIPLVVGYSGHKADTASLLKIVADKYISNKDAIDKIFHEIQLITDKAKIELEKEELNNVGTLMTETHLLLKRLGVSTQMLDAMVESAIGAGAYGAKLSGAGGGDCIIALIDEKHRSTVEKAIKKVGGEPFLLETQAEGVRLELS